MNDPPPAPKWRGAHIESPNVAVAPKAAELGLSSLRRAKQGLFAFVPMLLSMTLGMRGIARDAMIGAFLLCMIASAILGWRAVSVGMDAAALLKKEKQPRDVPATLGQALGWLEMTPLIICVIAIWLASEFDL